VLWLTLLFGRPPWVGLALAVTFGSYGALRKLAALGSVEGLLLETLLMFPLAGWHFWWLWHAGHNTLAVGPPTQQLLLLCAGPLTSIPLMLFAAGARRIPLSLVGLLQYIAPTLQLSLGVWVWHEPFGLARAVGYALIWLALAVYSAESLWIARAARTA
jgi:chloramphenicol-sensitive protein RarD